MRINISERYKNRSQRDNKVKPLDTCNVTSMINALTYMGYSEDFPDISTSKDKLSQPEDRLAEFFLSNEDILNKYKEDFPNYYKDFINKTTGYYNPFEIHEILSYGTNLWMGKEVTKFSEYMTLNAIVKELVAGRPLVVSGKFKVEKPNGDSTYYNHIVTLVGFEADNGYDTGDLINDPSKIDYFLLDDSYGKTGEYYSKKTVDDGNDVRLNFLEFVTQIKTLNSPTKWAHIFIER